MSKASQGKSSRLIEKKEVEEEPRKLRTAFSFSALRTTIIQKLLNRNRYDFLVAVAIVVYAIVFSSYMVGKNYGFGTFAWDLGIFNQSFYTTIFKGRFFYYTCELYVNLSGTYFASKFSPILFFVLPFYAISPSIDTLLILKSAVLALGAVPLYLLSKEMIGSKKAGFVMALAYLLSPGLQSSNAFDFQQQIFIPLMIFSSYYFMIKKRWKLYFLFALLSLMIEEHVAVILFLIAFFELLTTNRLKTVVKQIKRFQLPRPNTLSSVLLGTMVLSASGYFISRLARSVYPISPTFVDLFRATSNYSVLGFTNDILSLPTYILMHPQRTYDALAFDFQLKFLFLIFLFAPLAFVSFRSKLSLAVAILLVPFLLSNYAPYYTLGAHYPLYFLPLVFLAAVEGLSSIIKERKPNSTISSKGLTSYFKIIIITSLIIIVAVSPLSPLSQAFTKSGIIDYSQPYSDSNYVKTLHNIIDIIPQNASILTQNNLFPQFSNRINAYVVPVVQTTSDSESGAIKSYILQELNESDYVLLDSIGLGTDPWTNFVLNLLNNSSDFKIRAIGGSAVLFMRDYKGPVIFVPYVNYELFVGHSDFIIPYAQVVNDPTSNSGYIAYSQKGANYSVFVYGPYAFLPSGTFNITFEMKFGEHAEGYLGTIDVSEDYGASISCKEDLYGFNTATNTWINYTLSLETTVLRSLVEFRIFTTGASDIYFDRVIVKRVSQSADTDFGTKTYRQYDLLLGTGVLTPDGFGTWNRNVSRTVLWYGPYVTLPQGTYKTTFFIKAAPPISSPDQKVLTLDITSLFGANQLATRDVYASDMFGSANASSWRGLALEFTTSQQLNNVEFRGIDPSPNFDIYLAFILIERIT